MAKDHKDLPVINASRYSLTNGSSRRTTLNANSQSVTTATYRFLDATSASYVLMKAAQKMISKSISFITMPRWTCWSNMGNSLKK
jgi:hypothetical protein